MSLLKTEYVVEGLNYLYMESSKRRFWADITTILFDRPDQISVELIAMKKTWLGWFRYKTEFYVQDMDNQFEFGWERPYTGLIQLCESNPNVFHCLGEFSYGCFTVGLIEDKKLGAAQTHIRIKTRGSADVSGVLRVLVSIKGIGDGNGSIMRHN